MLLPILNVDSQQIPQRVLVVGEPARSRRAATRLDDAVEIGDHRESTTLVGYHRGVGVAVVSK